MTFIKPETVVKSTIDTKFCKTVLEVKEGIWLSKVQIELYPPADWQKKKEEGHTRLVNANKAPISSLTTGKFKVSMRHLGLLYFNLKEIIQGETGNAEIEYIRMELTD